MTESSAKNVVQFLIPEIFLKFGVTNTIHSDSGKQFISKEYKNMTAAYGMHDSKTNGSTNLYLMLSDIECALRSSIHSAIGVSFFASFGYHMY